MKLELTYEEFHLLMQYVKYGFVRRGDKDDD